jgi:hypothetical protein
VRAGEVGSRHQGMAQPEVGKGGTAAPPQKKKKESCG